MNNRLVMLALLCGAPALAATPPPALPAGLYVVNGVALSSSSQNFCPVKKGQSFTGTVNFPGAGNQPFEIDYAALNPNGAIDQVRFYAFPTVPEAGLNGWSTSHPAGTDVETFENGRALSGPGNTGEVAFALNPVIAGYPPTIGGQMSVRIVTTGACQQSYTILMHRIADATVSK